MFLENSYWSITPCHGRPAVWWASSSWMGTMRRRYSTPRPSRDLTSHPTRRTKPTKELLDEIGNDHLGRHPDAATDLSCLGGRGRGVQDRRVHMLRGLDISCPRLWF